MKISPLSLSAGSAFSHPYLDAHLAPASSGPAPTRADTALGSVAKRSTIEVAIVDEAPLIVYGLRSMLAGYSGLISMRVARLEDRLYTPVDITLYDPTRHASGRARLAELVADPARGLVVMYALTPSAQTVADMMGRGCAGFVDKAVPASQLVDVLTAVVAEHDDATAPSDSQDWLGKQYGLSRRESEVLGMITLGLTNDDISAQAYLSINTVKSYIRSAYRKIGITRRPQAVRWGMENGLGALRASR